MRFEAWPFAALLALVPVLLVLYAYAFRERRRALRVFIEHAPADLVPGASERWRWLRATMLLGAVAALIVALMQPQWGEGEQGLAPRGRDIVIVLDVSLSMLAEDAAPDRLTRAKAAGRALIEAARADAGHRMALLTFAGRADVQAPLTRDDHLLLERLEAASVEQAGQRGSAIGAALVQAVGMLGALEPTFTDLVLISDGEDHGGGAVEAARVLAAQGFTVHTIGIGEPGRAVPVPTGTGPDHLVHQGQEVRTRMREGLLTAIAEAGSGAYIKAADDTSPADLYRDAIKAEPRREIDSEKEHPMAHRFQVFAFLALALLSLEMVLRERKEAPA